MTGNGQKVGLRICNYCGKTYLSECDCKASARHRSERIKRFKSERPKDDFYNSPYWRAISRAVRVRDYNSDRLRLYFSEDKTLNVNTEWMQVLFDIVNTADGKRLIVHHIEPREENKARQYDLENLITIDTSVHDFIHRLYFTDAKTDVQRLLFKAVRWSP